MLPLLDRPGSSGRTLRPGASRLRLCPPPIIRKRLFPTIPPCRISSPARVQVMVTTPRVMRGHGLITLAPTTRLAATTAGPPPAPPTLPPTVQDPIPTYALNVSTAASLALTSSSRCARNSSTRSASSTSWCTPSSCAYIASSANAGTTANKTAFVRKKSLSSSLLTSQHVSSSRNSMHPPSSTGTNASSAHARPSAPASSLSMPSSLDVGMKDFTSLALALNATTIWQVLSALPCPYASTRLLAASGLWCLASRLKRGMAMKWCGTFSSVTTPALILLRQSINHAETHTRVT